MLIRELIEPVDNFDEVAIVFLQEEFRRIAVLFQNRGIEVEGVGFLLGEGLGMIVDVMRLTFKADLRSSLAIGLRVARGDGAVFAEYSIRQHFLGEGVEGWLDVCFVGLEFLKMDLGLLLVAFEDNFG